MAWFEKRFGPGRKTNDKEIVDKILSDWEKGGNNGTIFRRYSHNTIVWDVEGDPFSLISDEKNRQQQKDEELKERIKDLEAKFMESVPEVSP